jgi:hypothetical protein
MEQSERNRPEVPKETKEEVHNAMRTQKLYCTRSSRKERDVLFDRARCCVVMTLVPVVVGWWWCRKGRQRMEVDTMMEECERVRRRKWWSQHNWRQERQRERKHSLLFHFFLGYHQHTQPSPAA